MLATRTINETPLSAPQRRGLLLLLSQEFIDERPGEWASRDGQKVKQQVVIALGERGLVRFLVDNHRKRRHRAKLTEVGLHVARDVLHQTAMGYVTTGMRQPVQLSEEATRFIAEIVS